MKFFCYILGHKHTYIARLSDRSHLVCCKRCKSPFGINTDVRITLPFDLELHDLYSKYYKKEYKKAINALNKYLQTK